MPPADLLLLLQGGLGNQLFQVVLARSLAERWDRPLVVDPVLLRSRLRRLRGLTPRGLSPLVAQLLPGAIQPTPWHHRAGPRLAARWPGPAPRWRLNDAGLAQAAAAGDPLERWGAIRLLRTHATHPALYAPPFQPAWRRIAAALQPLATDAPPTVALHVRRGDYLLPRSGFHPLPPGYYQRALAALRWRAAPLFEAAASRGARPVLHVFTDDPAWCRTHLGGIGWDARIEVGSAEQDLARLASARALVISNSSFSAVAAHLARLRDPSTVVVCPDRWLLEEDGRLGDLRGTGWLTVEA
jgi:hypothetical protein